MLFPADVRMTQINALLKAINSFGGSVDVARISKELDTDLTQLLPLLDAAEMLGVITVEKGDVKLTEVGQRMLNSGHKRALVVRDALKKLEPFATALQQKGRFTSSEIADTLSSRGIRWHHEDEVNRSIIEKMLLIWGIYADILEYDGSNSTFIVKQN